MSSQLSVPVPAWQLPPAHTSPVVQALPSLQDAALFVCAQPESGLHESVVQPLPSLQFNGEPPRQAPPKHASPVVQALASSQGAALNVWKQPEAGLHASSVQGLPSPQLTVSPAWQLPRLHVSFAVQALPSSQDTVLSAWTHPVAGSHESTVQRLPSSQAAVLSAWMHPAAGSHKSSVQPFPSSHEAELSAWTHPETGSHESTVQALPSSQAAGLLAWVHPVAGLHESSVQALPSSQL